MPTKLEGKKLGKYKYSDQLQLVENLIIPDFIAGKSISSLAAIFETTTDDIEDVIRWFHLHYVRNKECQCEEEDQ